MPGALNLYEAKTQLSSLVDRAAKGEEFVIAKNGRPMAKLVPYKPYRAENRAKLGARFASARTSMRRSRPMSSRDFWDAPLSDVKLLLDTHVILWWQSDDRRLNKAARQAIATADVVWVSAV